MGSNRLTKLPQLLGDIEAVLNGPERLGRVPPLWDGHTAERTLDELIKASAPSAPLSNDRVDGI